MTFRSITCSTNEWNVLRSRWRRLAGARVMACMCITRGCPVNIVFRGINLKSPHLCTFFDHCQKSAAVHGRGEGSSIMELALNGDLHLRVPERTQCHGSLEFGGGHRLELHRREGLHDHRGERGLGHGFQVEDIDVGELRFLHRWRPNQVHVGAHRASALVHGARKLMMKKSTANGCVEHVP
jgi:hypothetical protein